MEGGVVKKKIPQYLYKQIKPRGKNIKCKYIFFSCKILKGLQTNKFSNVLYLNTKRMYVNKNLVKKFI